MLCPFDSNSGQVPTSRQSASAPLLLRVGRPAPHRAIPDGNAEAHVLLDQSMERRGFSRLGGRGRRIEVLRL